MFSPTQWRCSLRIQLFFLCFTLFSSQTISNSFAQNLPSSLASAPPLSPTSTTNPVAINSVAVSEVPRTDPENTTSTSSDLAEPSTPPKFRSNHRDKGNSPPGNPNRGRGRDKDKPTKDVSPKSSLGKGNDRPNNRSPRNLNPASGESPTFVSPAKPLPVSAPDTFTATEPPASAFTPPSAFNSPSTFNPSSSINPPSAFNPPPQGVRSAFPFPANEDIAPSASFETVRPTPSGNINRDLTQDDDSTIMPPTPTPVLSPSSSFTITPQANTATVQSTPAAAPLPASAPAPVPAPAPADDPAPGPASASVPAFSPKSSIARPATATNTNTKSDANKTKSAVQPTNPTEENVSIRMAEDSNNNQAQSTTGPSPSKTLVIAATAASSFVLFSGLSGMFLFYRRKKNRTKSISLAQPLILEHPSFASMEQEVLTVFIPYIPELEDELRLNVGDRIVVQERFQDNWLLGTNVTTGAVGCFPALCLDANVASSIASEFGTMRSSAVSISDDKSQRSFSLVSSSSQNSFRDSYSTFKMSD